MMRAPSNLPPGVTDRDIEAQVATEPTIRTVAFVGKTHSDARAMWSKFCDKQKREPFMVGFEARKVGALAELTVRFTDTPEDGF